MIKIKHLYNKTKNFELEIKDFEISHGEKIAIMGANGAGKTSFMESILKLRKNKIFDVAYDDGIIMNAVFQESGFNNAFTCEDIIKLFSKFYGVSNEINKLLYDFDLIGLNKETYDKLSGGQKQKMKILIAFLNDPELLVLDEVTISLDAMWRDKIIKMLLKFYEENPSKTLIIVTHSIEEAALLCDRLVLIKKGKIIKDEKIDKFQLIKEKDVILNEIFN